MALLGPKKTFPGAFPGLSFPRAQILFPVSILGCDTR